LCNDINCSNVLYFQKINQYAIVITDSRLSVAELSILIAYLPSGGVVSTCAAIARQVFVLALIMVRLWSSKNWRCCRLHAAYHYAIRRVKRNTENIISEIVADAMLQSNARNFSSDVRRIRSSKSVNSRIVDNETDSRNVANVFTDNYREFYTSVSYNVTKMQCITNDANGL